MRIDGGNLHGALSIKASRGHLDRIVQNPSRNHGVEHQKDIVADHGQIAHQVPFRSLLLQHAVRGQNASVTCPSHGVFHGHDRDAENCQKDDVDEYKKTAAVLAGDVWESPYIADAYGTACRQKNESKPGSERFSFFHISPNKNSWMMFCGTRYRMRVYCKASRSRSFRRFLRTLLMWRSKSPLLIRSVRTYCSKVGTVLE